MACRQAIIWTSAGLLSTGPLVTNCSEILIKPQHFPFKKLRLKMSSAKWRPFCIGLNELRGQGIAEGLKAYCTSSRKEVESIDIYDDVIKWKHFPRYWPFSREIHRSPVNSPHKSQWRVALMFSFIYSWTNGWANNDEAGNLRRHHAHCDVTLMILEKTGNESRCTYTIAFFGFVMIWYCPILHIFPMSLWLSHNRITVTS